MFAGWSRGNVHLDPFPIGMDLLSDDMEIANSMTNGGWGDPLFGPQIHERESFNKWKDIKTKLGQGTRKT